MAYTLGQAARATGKAKPTIARAIQTGRISAARSDTGSWQIEASELHRIYPPAGQMNGPMLRDLPGEPASASLAELLAERDRLVAEQESTIADLRESVRDLRTRLDSEVAERRTLIAMLTDRRPWWRRWFR